MIIFGYIVLRYYYNVSTPQDSVNRSPQDTTFNVANFKKKDGKPMFDPEEMISVEKDEETPEGKKQKKNLIRKTLVDNVRTITTFC